MLTLEEGELLLKLVDKQIIKLDADVRYLLSQGRRSLHRERYRKELEVMRSIRYKIGGMIDVS